MRVITGVFRYVVGYSTVFRDMWGARSAIETYRVAFPLALKFLCVRMFRNRMLAYTQSLYQAIVDERFVVSPRHALPSQAMSQTITQSDSR